MSKPTLHLAMPPKGERLSLAGEHITNIDGRRVVFCVDGRRVHAQRTSEPVSRNAPKIRQVYIPRGNRLRVELPKPEEVKEACALRPRSRRFRDQLPPVVVCAGEQIFNAHFIRDALLHVGPDAVAYRKRNGDYSHALFISGDKWAVVMPMRLGEGTNPRKVAREHNAKLERRPA